MYLMLQTNCSISMLPWNKALWLLEIVMWLATSHPIRVLHFRAHSYVYDMLNWTQNWRKKYFQKSFRLPTPLPRHRAAARGRNAARTKMSFQRRWMSATAAGLTMSPPERITHRVVERSHRLECKNLPLRHAGQTSPSSWWCPSDLLWCPLGTQMMPSNIIQGSR